MIWNVIAVVWAIALVWCMWGFLTAPTMPDDWRNGR